MTKFNKPVTAATIDQILRSEPGKFEGEGAATRYFWNLSLLDEGELHMPQYCAVLDDEFDNTGPIYTLFTVDADEAARFPCEGFKCGDTVIVFECDQGFVSMVAFGSREAAMGFVRDHSGVSAYGEAERKAT